MSKKSASESPSGRPGRRTTAESYEARRRILEELLEQEGYRSVLAELLARQEGCRVVLEELLKQHMSGLTPGACAAMEYQDIEEACGVERRTARLLCRDVFDICSRVKPYERGIQVDASTYFQERRNAERPVKARLAQCLSAAVRDCPVNAMAFGPGTTVLAGAQDLAAKNWIPKVVITNNLGVYEALSGYEMSDLIVTGGQYRRSIHAFVGDSAVRAFREAHCEAAVLGVSAVSIEGELLVKHPEEPEVLRQMLSSTTERIFVITSIEKLASRDTFPVVRIEDILKQPDGQKQVTIITNSSKAIQDAGRRTRAEAVMQKLRAMGERVKVVNADDISDSRE